MNSRDAVDVSLTFVVRCGIIAIMYLLLFKFNLPYLQVLLAYAGLEALSRVYDNTIHHAIVSGASNHRSAMDPVTAVILVAALVFFPLLAVPGMALLRFSRLQAGGLLLTGIISGMAVNRLFGSFSVRRMHN